MQTFNHQQFRRILIIKPSSFGDIIHALPVLNGLRRRYPTSHISWLVSSSLVGLLEGHPALDSIIPFDRKHYGRIGRSLKATIDFTRFVGQLNRSGFDLVLDLQGLFRSAFMALTTGAGVRIGFDAAREMAPMLYTRRIRSPRTRMHAVDANYLVARSLGFDHEPLRFDLAVNDVAREAMRRQLVEKGVRQDQDYIVVVPGTRWETKRWPVNRFVQVIEEFSLRRRLPVVLAGAPDEMTIAQELTGRVRSPLINLVGGTTIPQLVALIAGARLAVMHDTGPMHLAAALGTPMVTLYGPTDPLLTGPYHREETILRVEVACSPCRIRRVSECPHGHRCMQELETKRVLERIEALLSEEGTC